MKKLMLIVLCALLLTGCSSGVSQEEYESVVAERDEYRDALESIAALFDSAGDVSSNSETKAIEEMPQKINLLDSGWVIYKNNDYTHIKYAVQIENPNEEYAVRFPKIQITARDAEGKILSTEEMTLNSIAADDTIYYGNEVFYEGDEPSDVEITVFNSDDDYETQDDLEYVKYTLYGVSLGV